MKQQVTEPEAVRLLKELGFNERITFSFGPNNLSLHDNTEKLEAIRDDQELQSVRDFKTRKDFINNGR